MDPLIITVAAVGAELSRAEQPNLPITPEELAADAAACEAAGATIYHLHVRAPDGTPTMDVEIYRAAHEAIRTSTDLIVQFSSGGAVTDTEEARIAPLSLRPEMASLTTGSVNFGDDVFANPYPLVARFYERMRSLRILPEFEIFEPGMLATAERVYQDAGSDHHRHYDFVLGVPGAMPAWDDALEYLTSHLPSDATWSATGIGRAWEDIARVAIAANGHVRTGFEDVRWLARGVVVTSNAQLIERVVELATEARRTVATPAETRSMLGLEGVR